MILMGQENLMMNQKKSNKYYSSLQEKRIATHLGWVAVSASGARPFHPGDLKSCDWLAECKTHTSETDTIVITKSVWQKISTEAKSLMKKPVLFVDNGTQNLSDTWAIFPKRLYYGTKLQPIDLKISETDKKYTFKHGIFLREFSDRDVFLPISVFSEVLYITRESKFKEIFCEDDD
jgi:hypothetical protein